MQIETRYDTILERLLPDVLAHRAIWSDKLAKKAFVLGERPAFFTQTRHDALIASASLVIDSLLAIPKRIFGDDIEALARFLDEPALTSPWFVAQYAKAGDQLLARPDTIFDGKDYKVIDQNVSSAAGCYVQTTLIGEYFATHPVYRALAEEVELRVDSLYDALSRAVGLEGKRAAKLLYYDVPLSTPKRQRWASKLVIDDLAARGIDAEIVDDARLPAAMRSRARDRVVILRAFIPSVMRGATRCYRNFRRTVLEGKVRILNNAWESAFFNKLFLALLSDPRTLSRMPSSDRARLRRAVPWTRVLRPDRVRFRGKRRDLHELVLGERQHFLLKKGDSFSSRHVIYGLSSSEAAWKRAIGRATASGGWVVQELVPGIWERTPVLVDGRIVPARTMTVDSPFLVGGRAAGVLRRERCLPMASCPGLPRGIGMTMGVVHAG